MINVVMSESEASAVEEVLSRRANEVASFKHEHVKTMPGSVELAIDREIKRLRSLADKFRQPTGDE